MNWGCTSLVEVYVGASALKGGVLAIIAGLYCIYG
jgi:hypothetical protein